MLLLFEPINKKSFEISLVYKDKIVNGFKFTPIINDSYANLRIDNTFSVFNSNNNILYLIYATKNKSIICYNLNKFIKINEIKNAHSEYITNFRHIF